MGRRKKSYYDRAMKAVQARKEMGVQSMGTTGMTLNTAKDFTAQTNQLSTNEKRSVNPPNRLLRNTPTLIMRHNKKNNYSARKRNKKSSQTKYRLI